MKNKNGIVFSTNDGSLLICNGVDVSAVPDTIEVLAEGSYQKRPDGSLSPFSITAADVDAAAAHFKARKERHPERDIVLDYEHQTLGNNEAPAAGWISDVNTAIRDGKKVLNATVSTWTKKAKQYIENKEYRYVSPVFVLKSIDKETGKVEPCILKNVALTNEPFLDDLAPIVAKHISQTILGKDTTMDDLLERLRYFLNLPITATAAECQADLQKLIDQLKTAAADTVVTAKEILAFIINAKSEIAAKATLVKEICAKDGGTIEEARVVFVAAKDAQTQLIAAKEELATLKTAKFDSEFNTIIAKAETDGKILPVQKNDTQFMSVQKDFAAKDMTAFAAYWEKQPKVAPTGALPASGAQEVAAKNITEEDIAFGKKVGVTKEQLAKHNKLEGQ